MAKILVIHGPNLNLLGRREPGIYGNTTLEGINSRMEKLAQQHGVGIVCFQSNSEGEIIDIIHRESRDADCLILNPGAYTHYSIAIADAVKAVDIPTVEVHLSNIFSREEFRHHSVITPVAVGQITGFGSFSYELAFFAVLEILNRSKEA